MKRHVLIAVIFLLAGAVVNVAVAWGIVLRSPVNPEGPPFERVSGASAWPRPVPADWPPPLDQTLARSWGLSELYTIAHVVIPPPRPPKGTWIGVGMTLFRAGWPCRSLEAEYQGKQFMDLPLVSRWRYSLTLPEPLTIIRHEEARYRPLPYRPIWPDFAVNTLFYAAILSLLICGLFALRRLIRRKRGQCVKCGYPPGNSPVCTECGRELQDKPQNTG